MTDYKKHLLKAVRETASAGRKTVFESRAKALAELIENDGISKEDAEAEYEKISSELSKSLLQRFDEISDRPDK